MLQKYLIQDIIIKTMKIKMKKINYLLDKAKLTNFFKKILSVIGLVSMNPQKKIMKRINNKNNSNKIKHTRNIIPI